MASLDLLDYKVCPEMTGKLVQKVQKDTEDCSDYKDCQAQQDPQGTKDRWEIVELTVNRDNKDQEGLRVWTEMLAHQDYQELLAHEDHKGRKENVE